MLSLFRQGGWVMYPLLAFSVVSIAVILERTVFFLSSRARSIYTVEELTVLYKECGDWKAAVKKICGTQKGRVFSPDYSRLL
jgi:biopolymer transport protein ExbB/TolQ